MGLVIRNFNLRFLNMIIFVTSVTFIIVMAGIIFQSMKAVQQSEISESNKSLVRVIGELMSSGLKMGQDSEIYRECKKVYKNPNIKNIQVTTSDGQGLCNLADKSGQESMDISKRLYFDETNENLLGTVRIVFLKSSASSSSLILISLLIIFSLVFLFFYLVSNLLTNHVVKPIQLLSEAVNSNSLLDSQKRLASLSFRSTELSLLKERLDKSIVNALDKMDQDNKIQILEANNRLSNQVSHDIRSPLASLKIISSDLEELPEDVRTILIASINRIQDISNELSLKRSISDLDFSKEEAQNLYPLIMEIISEKKTQYRSHQHIQLTFQGTDLFSLNSVINPMIFKSIISNILNNSYEELWINGGKISLTAGLESGQVVLLIADSGKGIPVNFLNEIFKEGKTFGKDKLNESGSGLGLFQAKVELEKRSGRIELVNKPNSGAIFRIQLPQSEKPDWLLSQISFKPDQKIIVLDDDKSVMRLWERLFDKFQIPRSNLVYYSNLGAFKAAYATFKKESFVLLLDYHFSGESKTGLELFEFDPDLCSKTILVTNQYDDKEIIESIVKSELKLLPKVMLPYVSLGSN